MMKQLILVALFVAVAFAAEADWLATPIRCTTCKNQPNADSVFIINLTNIIKRIRGEKITTKPLSDVMPRKPKSSKPVKSEFAQKLKALVAEKLAAKLKVMPSRKPASQKPKSRKPKTMVNSDLSLSALKNKLNELIEKIRRGSTMADKAEIKPRKVVALTSKPKSSKPKTHKPIRKPASRRPKPSKPKSSKPKTDKKVKQLADALYSLVEYCRVHTC